MRSSWWTVFIESLISIGNRANLKRRGAESAEEKEDSSGHHLFLVIVASRIGNFYSWVVHLIGNTVRSCYLMRGDERTGKAATKPLEFSMKECIKGTRRDAAYLCLFGLQRALLRSTCLWQLQLWQHNDKYTAKYKQ